MSAIAIITARGGSKRIPRKNIRLFLGKPMIAWPIEAALKSGAFDRVLVSTDDEEIAEIAQRFGAEIPALRSASLADDFAPAHKAAKDMLERAVKTDPSIRHFCHIYPTAPMLSAETLRLGMEKLCAGPFKSVWAMVNIAFPIYQIMGEKPDGKLFRFFEDDKAAMRSQDMPKAYIDVGQAYFFEVAHFLEHEVRVDDHLGMIEVPMETAIDIDTEDDWLRAERTARLMAGG